MSDSDSTWPATDDFGSRFLEIDEYAVETLESELSFVQDDLSPPEVCNDATDPSCGFSETSSSFDPNNELRANRGLRLRSFIELEIGDEEDDMSTSDFYGVRTKRTRMSRSAVNKHNGAQPDSEEDLSFKGFRPPKVTTARQRSLQMQRAAAQQPELYGLKHSQTEPAFLSLESLEPTKSSSIPTPEQLAARQLSITRRRESAKRKVEMEKRQTLERLLKINADSDNFNRRGRGRGRGARSLSHSASTSMVSHTPNTPVATHEYDNSANVSRTEDDDASGPDLGASENSDATPSARTVSAEQHASAGPSLGPPSEYIRVISSSRLSPVNRICFPSSVADEKVGPSWIFAPKPLPIIPEVEPCAAGCGRIRRYKCSKTGVPLCSLACYKQNLANYATAH